MSGIKKAVYPGTFDPPTNGHIDIARRASLIFDKVIIAVTNNSVKTTLFSIEERLFMLRETFKGDPKIEVKSFTGLTIDFTSVEGANAIVRGLRAVSDFEYELQIASMNYSLNHTIETLFLMASDENLFTSSSVIKELALYQADISQRVPPVVAEHLKRKFQTKS